LPVLGRNKVGISMRKQNNRNDVDDSNAARLRRWGACVITACVAFLFASTAAYPDAPLPPPANQQAQTQTQIQAPPSPSMGLTIQSVGTPNKASSTQGEVSLRSILVVTVAGLADAAKTKSINPNQLYLVANGWALKGVVPVRVDLSHDQIYYLLDPASGGSTAARQADAQSWSKIIGSNTSGSTLLIVSLANDSVEIKGATPAQSTITLRIFDPWSALFALIVVVIMGGLLIWLCATTSIVRDRATTAPPTSGAAYSLARCQLAFFSFVIIATFIFIWLATGSFNGVLTAQCLVLLGISTATTAGSTIIDSDKSNKGAPPPAHVNFFSDILTDSTGITVYRFQVLVWTLLMGAMFVLSAFQQLTLPVFDNNLLILSGLSSATYIGLKIPESP
jgi:hypothetical protein